MENIPTEKERDVDMEDIPENNKKMDDLPSMMELSRDNEITPSEAGMEDHELQKILEKENLDIEKFLEQGITKGVDSFPKEEFGRVQQLFHWRAQKKCSGVKRKHDNQDNRGVKMMEDTTMLYSNNPDMKRGRKKHNELLSECGKLMIEWEDRCMQEDFFGDRNRGCNGLEKEKETRSFFIDQPWITDLTT